MLPIALRKAVPADGAVGGAVNMERQIWTFEWKTRRVNKQIKINSEDKLGWTGATVLNVVNIE